MGSNWVKCSPRKIARGSLIKTNSAKHKLQPEIRNILTIIITGNSILEASKGFVYLDDIVIYGRILEDHNNNLTDVLERYQEHNLKLKVE